MTPIITAFARSPDRGRGMARDMRVRWAFEETGQPYDLRLVPFETRMDVADRAANPFCKIPTYEEDGLTLFESGAIVLHIAQQHLGLLPPDAHARARAVAWMFAALNTIEPPILDRQYAVFFEAKEPWFAQRLARVDERIRKRLDELSLHLGERDWLDGGFSAGDLMMVMVLRWLATSPMLDAYPKLSAYVARGEARPAFQRAFAAQLATFTASSAG